MANLVGQKVGQYQIVGLIGEGGMAVVYQARQESIKRDVAIKVIRPGMTNMEEFSRRFQQEAQTVAGLSHAHILKIFDYGQQDDIVYLVMELLTGGSLDQLIKKGPISLATAATLLEQISSALDYAHHKGIIHRDLKPENILLDESGNPFITDFGLAKLLNSTTKLTQSGAALGTPAYMAPEQWRAESLDARTDIYALGVVLFEMLSGTVPFKGDSALSMMYLHLHEAPRHLHEQNPSVPIPVQNVIEKALAKLPDDRYQSAGELASDFRLAASGQLPTKVGDRKTALPAKTRSAQPAPTGRTVQAAQSATPAGDRKNSANTTLTALLALVIVALIVGIGIFAVQRLRSMSETLPVAAGLPTQFLTPTTIAQSAASQTEATQATSTVPAANVATSATIASTASSTLAPTMTITMTATMTPTTMPTASALPTFTLMPLPPTQGPPPGGLQGSIPGGLTLNGHSGPVNSVTFTPDGKYLVSGSDDHTARLWERTTGKLIHVFQGHTGAVNSVAISPKGDLLVTGGADMIAILWEVSTGKLVHTYNGHSDAITSVAFSPKGDLILTASKDGTAILWGTQSGQQVRTFSGAHTAGINHGAFSPDGTQIVTASADKTAVVWSAQTGQVLHTLTGHNGAVNSAIFSPGGGYILTGSADGTARLWKTPEDSPFKTLTGQGAQNVDAVAFSPDGNETYTTSDDGQVNAWSTLTGQFLHPMGPPAPATIKDVAFAPRPILQFAVALADNTIIIYTMGAKPPGAP